MALNRRQFLWTTAASAAAFSTPWGLNEPTYAQGAGRVFAHGVASGDPLTDRVILWTRVTPPEGTTRVDRIAWRVAEDEALTRVVARGVAATTSDRDFTVKIDAAGLAPRRTYFYAFEALGEQSPVGRTRTLPLGRVERVRIAQVCCANYPSGFFNVYRRVAEREDLDVVLHVGDYIYEFENGVYGDGTSLLRIPEPRREAVSLSDYRVRYATYRTDPDLQEAHRRQAFVAVWDDHELTNDAWSGGAANHNPEQGEGNWPTRKAAAYRAYLEWMPVREQAGDGIRLYRSLRFGDLADLVVLDTRGLRDRQVPTDDIGALSDPTRTMLGGEQEAWLFSQLQASTDAGTTWRLLGQGVMFSRLVPPGQPVLLSDTWEGYQASRDRIFDFLQARRITDVAVLGGDLHSSWALDVPRNPVAGYRAATGEGSLAVEILAPAISSPPLFAAAGLRERAPLLRAILQNLKYLEGDSRGYVVVDVTPERLQAEWFFVPTVDQRSAEESRAAAFVCERGSSRLVPV
jgi:alkaline phosphatase D